MKTRKPKHRLTGARGTAGQAEENGPAGCRGIKEGGRTGGTQPVRARGVSQTGERAASRPRIRSRRARPEDRADAAGQSGVRAKQPVAVARTATRTRTHRSGCAQEHQPGPAETLQRHSEGTVGRTGRGNHVRRSGLHGALRVRPFRARFAEERHDRPRRPPRRVAPRHTADRKRDAAHVRRHQEGEGMDQKGQERSPHESVRRDAL